MPNHEVLVLVKHVPGLAGQSITNLHLRLLAHNVRMQSPDPECGINVEWPEYEKLTTLDGQDFDDSVLTNQAHADIDSQLRNLMAKDEDEGRDE